MCMYNYTYIWVVPKIAMNDIDIWVVPKIAMNDIDAIRFGADMQNFENFRDTYGQFLRLSGSEAMNDTHTIWFGANMRKFESFRVFE